MFGGHLEVMSNFSIEFSALRDLKNVKLMTKGFETLKNLIFDLRH
jgi:hypothetical protein